MGGRIASQKRANKRMALVVPITVLAIFLILYTMFRSAKWAMLILVSVVMASIGGPLALFITHTNFSVSSAVGFLALFGVSVQAGVIMIEFINQLRGRRKGMEVSTEEHIIEAAVEGAVLRLRPIMMTMLRCCQLRLAGGTVSCDRLGLATPLCNCHRGRAAGQSGHRHLPAADALCLGGAQGRHPPGGREQRGILIASSGQDAEANGAGNGRRTGLRGCLR